MVFLVCRSRGQKRVSKVMAPQNVIRSSHQNYFSFSVTVVHEKKRERSFKRHHFLSIAFDALLTSHSLSPNVILKHDFCTFFPLVSYVSIYRAMNSDPQQESTTCNHFFLHVAVWLYLRPETKAWKSMTSTRFLWRHSCSKSLPSSLKFALLPLPSGKTVWCHFWCPPDFLLLCFLPPCSSCLSCSCVRLTGSRVIHCCNHWQRHDWTRVFA